jgi:hypothetical protein
MSLRLTMLRTTTIIVLTSSLSSCVTDPPKASSSQNSNTSSKPSEKKLLCSQAVTDYVSDIVRSGARVRDFRVMQDQRETPFTNRKNTLNIQLVSPESVGVTATPAELEAGIRVAKNESALLFHGNNIMSRCTDIASVSVSLHELDSEVFLHRDYSVKLSECVEVNQNPRWGQRICT